MGKHGTHNYMILPTRYLFLWRWIKPHGQWEKHPFYTELYLIMAAEDFTIHAEKKTGLILKSRALYNFMWLRNECRAYEQITLFFLIFLIETTPTKSFYISLKRWKLCVSLFFDCKPRFPFFFSSFFSVFFLPACTCTNTHTQWFVALGSRWIA